MTRSLILPALIFVAVFPATSFNRLASFSRLPVTEKIIALTFDDHFDKHITKYGAEKILDTLKLNNLRCTFFLTGELLKIKPDLVRRIIADGHEIGNHTWTHAWVRAENDSEKRLLRELKITQEYFFQNFTGPYTHFWRAPHGHVNEKTMHWAHKIGLKHIGWTYDMYDWDANPKSKTYRPVKTMLKIFRRLIDSNSGQGAIILLHLESARKTENVAEILQEMIDYVKLRGYTFAKISDYF